MTVQNSITVLGLLAVSVLATAAANAEVVIMDGTLNYTTRFGLQPPRDIDLYGTQTVNGALNIPRVNQNFSTMMTTQFQTGVVISFMNTVAVTGIGPGNLAAGFRPGGLAQPRTFAPAENLPVANIPVGPAILRVGFKSAGGNHFGGVLAVAGFERNNGYFQTSPAFFIRQLATRHFPAGGVVGAAPTKRDRVSPITRLETAGGGTIMQFTGSESRIGFPWTTGSISGVAQIGPAVPYGGAGNIGTPAQATAPINFRTVAGFDSRVFNPAQNTLTGNLQLVSPMVQVANYALSGPNSLAPFWELTVSVVPEPEAVGALAAGLVLVAGTGIRRLRRR